jgi:RHS repeat-associated protein
VNDPETGLTYMQQRYYDPMAGRFMSVDPVLTDGNTGASFNRYVYANNNPHKYTDPDGRNPALVARVTFKISFEVASALGARRLGEHIGIRLYDALNGPVQNENTEAASSTDSASGSANSAGTTTAPALPDKIVGDQSDSRAGPNKNGSKHTSGPLTPANGGKGDYKDDLETLTGGTQESKPGDKAPPGSQIGQNGIFGRDPNSSGGKSIDIPANGIKPHETLHY